MNKLSVVIITHNEEVNIANCIEGLSFADEVIVLDFASLDQTADLARSLCASVHSTKDWPGFGPQKNRALALAHGEWVLALDADERVDPKLAEEIRLAIASNSYAAYEIPRLTQFCGQWIHHCGWQPDYVLRLFRRNRAKFSDDLVHERVVLAKGELLGRLSSPLLHLSYPSPTHYWQKLERYSEAWAKQRHSQGQKASMFRAGLAGLVAFFRSYFFQLGILDGAMGFAVCTMQAEAAFSKYFTLYYLNHKDDHARQ
ncbi:glycosyltransferase family 2 protein [Shewanella vesiculosa]|uniref:glycosyltransferase family 2 protein n=1 Tax=Shewanella vesiculosa TaxID=518738 RepID=UPI00235A1A81|nr:glycosyltransferase family 2 protein [Shewanella vesiculosa]NCP72656.1 glycosyltransferase family 2 protein [Shewanella vesiculosa]